MPLENATTISQLDQSWPLGLDPASRGDDHLRLLKAVLKAQFPGSGGQGFSSPITVTEEQLNALPNQVNGLGDKFFPVGTVVLRMDAINPATLYGGTWQLITGDATLTFGDGTARNGSITGNNNPSVPLPKHGHGTTHNITVQQSGRHKHGGVPLRSRVEVGGSTGTLYSVYNDGETYESGDHIHGITGSVTVQLSGAENATLDVRGARISINVWRRTA